MQTQAKSRPVAAAAAVLLALAIPATAQAEGAILAAQGIGYHVGIDGLATIASGTFAGLANPNAGRLTLLYDHGDHYHGIGAYSYTGTAAAAVVRDTNANNRLPELSTRVSEATSSIPLQTGSGAYAGRWVSTGVPESAPTHGYSLLGLASIQTLPGLGEAANVLYNSSGGRWKTAYADLQVGLQLVSATAGLQVGLGSDTDIFDQGNTFALGSSNTLQFLPTFHVAQTAEAGVYSASFRLVSLGGSTSALDGGVFHVDFSAPAPVPEPQAALLLALGLAGLAWRQRRRSNGS